MKTLFFLAAFQILFAGRRGNCRLVMLRRRSSGPCRSTRRRVPVSRSGDRGCRTHRRSSHRRSHLWALARPRSRGPSLAPTSRRRPWRESRSRHSSLGFV